MQEAPAGATLRIYQGLQRLGIAAEVGSDQWNVTTGQTYRVVTKDGWYGYTAPEWTALAVQARQWIPGQTEQEILFT